MAPSQTMVALLELAALRKDDWEPSLQRILRVDSAALEVVRVGYWTLRPEPPSLFCELSYGSLLQKFERSIVLLERDHPRYFRELQTALVVAVEDARDDPRTKELETYLRTHEIVSMMDVPVWLGGELAGVLCHEHKGAPRAWSAAEQDFAVAAGQAVSTALEARARGRAESGERRASFLAELSASLSESLDFQEVADRALRTAVTRLADWAVIDLLEDDQMRRLAQLHRLPEKQAFLDDASRRWPPGTPGSRRTVQLTGFAARFQESVLFPVVGDEAMHVHAADPELIAWLRAEGTRSAMAAPFRLGDGVTGAVLFVSTRAHYDQEALRLAEEFAERTAAALVNARLYAEARRAIAARDEFLMLAAHELRTPVTSIQLAAESLARARTHSPETVRRLGGTIQRQTRQLGRLLDQILEACRSGGGRLVLHRERFDLAELARDVASDLAPALQRAGCPLELQADAPVIGSWDPVRAENILYLLLDNAMKFGAGTPIGLAVRAEHDKAVVTVADHGIGIPASEIGNVFDRFRRAVPPTAFGGLGLGLGLARTIAEAHGGQVCVQSEPGRGATFRVELPGVETAAQAG